MRHVYCALVLCLLFGNALLPVACHVADTVPLSVAEQFIDGTGSTNISWGTSAGHDLDLAQSFQVASTVACRGAALQIYSFMGAPTGDYTVRLETNGAGYPSGTLVTGQASKTRHCAELTPLAWNDWLFSSPVTLEAGQTYWIVCRTSEPRSGGNDLIWMVEQNPGSYTRGELFNCSDVGPWQTTGNDLNFKIYE